MIRCLSIVIMSIIASHACGQGVDFRRQIAPILQTRCLPCHSGTSPKGELDLTSEKGLKQGGSSGSVIAIDPTDSLLFSLVQSGKMPVNAKLSTEEKRLLETWILNKSPWEGPPLAPTRKNDLPQKAGPDWWSFQSIKRPTLPSVNDNQWIRQPIDAFILHELESRSLKPSVETDRRTYLRRVKLDLLGLPPTPAEIDAFLSDTSIDAYDKLVDRLLASPHYGERWGRHWLDVVRFAESHGYETNELRRNAWPYRDWVIRSFNQDKPFKQFVVEQLAGDVVAAGDVQNEVATGFLVAGTHDIVGNQSPEGKAQQRQDDLYDMVSATGATFLGLTVNCARCHDHKFDPISQRDYYGLQAVFAGTQHGVRLIKQVDKMKELSQLELKLNQLRSKQVELERHESVAGKPRASVNTELFPSITARYIRMTILATAMNDEPCLDELEIYSSEKNIALAQHGSKATASSLLPNLSIHQIAHLNDGRTGNNFSWISNEKGAGWAQIELASTCKIDRIVWGRDREKRFVDRLPTRYRFEASLDGKEWTLLCTEADRLKRIVPVLSEKTNQSSADLQTQLKAISEKISRIRDELSPYIGSFSQPEQVHLLKRGDPMQKLDLIGPSAISSIKVPWNLDGASSESHRRLALAEWITNQANPLPARVMVNRLWHYHFGTGIVNTPSDFGFNGGRPSHPDLLNWLASEFLSNGGRLKPLHRMIVLSSTYRQASQADGQVTAKAQTIDADNRLLWRFPRRRMEAEVLRDSILAINGQLDIRMGGPGYDLWKYSNYVVVFEPKEPLPKETNRRMVYQFKPRTQQDMTFGGFDCPDGTLSIPRRNVSSTPLQALNLLNSTFMHDASMWLSKRLEQEGGNSPESQVMHGFLLTMGRRPSEKELTSACVLARKHGMTAFCRALLNSNELIFID